MKLGIIAVVCIFDVIFAIAVIVWHMSKKNNKPADDIMVIEKRDKKAQDVTVTAIEEVKVEKKPEPKPVEIKEEKEEPIIEVKKEAKPLPKKVQRPPLAVAKVEPKPIEIKREEPVVDKIELEGEEEGSKLDINRVPFAKKLLTLDKNVQGYYNTLYNYFILHRKINPRVSMACASFRFGRDLVAKITVRGKTMKLHLALDVKKYDEAVYFQKDMGDVKAYSEVPFTVKVKSERALKKALELIAALAIEKGIEKKTRFEDIDALVEIKEKAKQSK